MSAPNQNDPLNLLSFDGGGVRGVSSLVILDRIMRRLQEKEALDELPRPCDYFDLMTGTSTGGLIAILLGRLRMTTKEALDVYDQVAGDIFCFKNRKIRHLKPWPFYNATALEETVKSMVETHTDKELMIHPGIQRGKAFVCAVDAETLEAAQRFRSYDLDDGDDDWLKDCTVWEAARATTAAPMFFKDITIQGGSVTKRFVDAAVGYNNPTEELLDEAARVFYRTRKIGAVVSLGTGTRRKTLLSPKDVGHTAYAISVAKTMKNQTVDPEAVHRRVQNTFKDVPNTYFRFNVPGAAETVSLGAWKKMDLLKNMTGEYLEQKAVAEEIENLVDVIREKKSQDLTVGHVCSLDQDQLLMDRQRAQRMGSSSAFFTGRVRILNTLKEHFRVRLPGDEKPRRQFLLCGMGGAGKTQIALKFAETTVADTSQTRRLFERFFWVDATDIVTALQGFEEIAKAAFPDKEPGKMSMEDVQNWIASLDEEWLLVLDNSTNKNIEQLIPPGNRGNILYTSRDQEIGLSLPPGSIAEVNDMKPDEAITLLLLTAGHTVAYNEALRAEAAPVVEQLGGLALAIDQAGAYIRSLKMSISDYSVLLKTKREELLRDPHVRSRDPRNQAVYATFDISYKAISDTVREYNGYARAEDARNALKVLRLICFYHNESVMAEMLARAAFSRHEMSRREEFPLGQGKDSLENLVGVRDGWNYEPFTLGCMLLEKFSLVKIRVDPKGLEVSMHVLVHAWARDSMGEAERAQRAKHARAILFDSLGYGKKLGDYAFRRRMAPHVEACLEHATGVEQDDPLLEGEYYDKLGTLYQQTGQFDKAQEAFEKCIEYRKWGEGHDGEMTLAGMNRLSRFYQSLGNFGEAERIVLEILELRAHKIDDLEQRIVTQEDKLSKLSQVTQQVPPVQQKARGISRYTLKPKVAEQPEPDYEKLIKDDKELLSLLYINQGRCLFRLEGIYMAQTSWDLAEQACIKTIGMRKVHAPDKVALSERNLASIRRSKAGLPSWSKPSESEAHAKVEEAYAAMNAAIEQHGEDHMTTLDALRDLARAELVAQNLRRAEELALDHRYRCELVFGKSHSRTLDALSLVAEVYLEEGEVIAAETARRELLRVSQPGLGLHHPDTIQCLFNLGMAIYLQGRFEEGLMIATRAHDFMNVRLGSNHGRVVRVRQFLDDVKEKAGDITIAEHVELAKECARNALHKHAGYTERLKVPTGGFDYRSEDLVENWIKFNHIARGWDDTDPVLPEKVYFLTKPPLYTKFFPDEQEAEDRQAHPKAQPSLDRKISIERFA